MKIKFLAACLSLASVIYATQSQEARAQTSGGEVMDEKLISCVKTGEVDCVMRVLAAGADANASDEQGTAVLSMAAEGKSARVVRILLDAGADVNNAGDDEGAPLCRAALFGRKEIVETLLEKGAKINLVCDADHGETPLMDAIRGVMFGDLPGDLREGLSETTDGDEVVDNDDAGATDEATDEAEKRREVLNAPRDNFLAIARLLLARGADVNVIANCHVGETPLMYAAMGANVELVKELLSHGADVNHGSSALHLLLEFEREYEQLKRLALPAFSKRQTTILEWHENVSAAREEIKRLLKAAGAKEVEDEDQGENIRTDAQALEEAAGEAFSNVIEKNDIKDFARLVDAYAAHPLGASMLPEALRKAIIYDRTEMIRLLLERGTSPNADSGMASSQPPLTQAAQGGKLEYVRMLLDAGADVNKQDKAGFTALDAAEQWATANEEDRALVELLKARGAKSKRTQQ
jgi:ankyrin repeat protein